jgi:hypothetical protein
MIESSLDPSLETQVCAANGLAAQAVAKPNAAAVGVADGFTDVHSFSTPVCTSAREYSGEFLPRTRTCTPYTCA